jgi:hypothetical protein
LNTKAEMEIYFGDMVSTEMAQNKIWKQSSLLIMIILPILMQEREQRNKINLTLECCHLLSTTRIPK